MRDPARIPAVLVALGELWARHPDWRLGQLMVNVAGRDIEGRVNVSALFNVEDDVLLRALLQELDVRTSGAGGGEQDDTRDEHDQPDQQAGAGGEGEVDRQRDEDDSEDSENGHT